MIICSSCLCFNFLTKIRVFQDGDLCTMEGLCGNLRIWSHRSQLRGELRRASHSRGQKHYRHRVPPEEDVTVNASTQWKTHQNTWNAETVTTRYTTLHKFTTLTSFFSRCFQKKFMTAMSRTMSKQNGIGVKAWRMIESTSMYLLDVTL